ncbi:ethanolamine ammonia-lyase subunit EutC [Domibacillus enclensis]|uniref:Ethanolamine ammonia-lyase small subunit n=1 Tax=Domibacillus enclensis TaxID=1017273 RepID=A0A1N6ZG06_9BACI|nr:ethanolamine ammonia-lyase subunit EutC [Domibacillus enclensis]OXS76692.1 ethanolamine ammonia-lyase [Domibacillus enclensis]SIR25715.1 Ethanolamine ammonia-lyase light chain [Domibacillus enclensis]
MDEQLIQTITKLVVEKLQTSENETKQEVPVTLYSREAKGVLTETSEEHKAAGEVTFHQTADQKPPGKKRQRLEPSPERTQEEELVTDLQAKTPARIAVGRAGSRPKTNTWLQFRLDHAAAVDAVYGEVPDELMNKLDLFQVSTRVKDKEEYIRRPDLGRKLSDEGKELIKKRCQSSPAVQIVVSNGLSAKAIEENAEDVYLSLVQSLNNGKVETGTSFYVDKGRVALMDEIGEILQPDVVILLIGERPGLVSAESLSAYLCYKPRIGTIEADRMVVSNIHKGGIPPVEAGAYLGTLIQKILKYEASGVSLVKREG